MRAGWSRFLLLVWLALLVGPAAWGKSQTVRVVLSGDDAAASEAVESLRGRLTDQDVLVSQGSDFAGVAPGLIVAVGQEALRRVLEAGEPGWQRVPVVAMLVPRYMLERGRGDRLVTGVYLDQPFQRQLALLRLAIPDRPRIGVLLGPTSRRYEAELLQAIKAAGLEGTVEMVGNALTLAKPLQAVLGESDVLFGVPDPAVFNNATAQNILRSAYRQRIPVIGFSAPFVRAGAMFAVHGIPARMGHQAAEMALRILAGEAPNAEEPRDFKVAVNDHVAHSFGLLLDEDRLTRQLAQAPSAGMPVRQERKRP